MDFLTSKLSSSGFNLSSMMKKNYVTKNGLVELKNELDHLKKVKRKEVSGRIRKALEEGDISESGEYSEAKDEQAFVEGRIAELSERIKNAAVIKKGRKVSKAEVGSTVMVKTDGQKSVYTIMGSSEVNPAEGKISNESPLGKAFLGHEAGEEVTVETPKGVTKFKILAVE